MSLHLTLSDKRVIEAVRTHKARLEQDNGGVQVSLAFAVGSLVLKGAVPSVPSKHVETEEEHALRVALAGFA